jgi:hypothetical protein
MIVRDGVIAAFLASFVSSPAWASNPGIDVVMTDCPEVQIPEVDRVLDLELSSVSSHWHGNDNLRAELTCEPSRLSILVVDPMTGKRLSRTVPMDWKSPDRDRTVALLVSQLFLTSWSELLMARDAARELAPPPVTPEVERAAADMARSSIKPDATQWAISIAVGPRLRDLPDPAVSGAGLLRPSLSLGRAVVVFFDVGYERGEAERTTGAVVFSLASVSLGAGWRRSFGALGLTANLRAGAAYVDLQGDPSGTALGASTSGTVAEAALELGPTLALGRARLGLLASAGATVPRVTAHVVGDRDVDLEGPWFGASLVASFPEAGP